MATPKSTNRAAITYAPNLDVMRRLAASYVGQAVTLACSGCDREQWTGGGEIDLIPLPDESVRERIVALFEHTAFEHAVRHDVVKLVTSVELVWEA